MAATILKSRYLTDGFADPELVRQISLTFAGMAYLAASGPLGKTCGDCGFWGYQREIRDRDGSKTGRTKEDIRLRQVSRANGSGRPGCAESGGRLQIFFEQVTYAALSHATPKAAAVGVEQHPARRSRGCGSGDNEDAAQRRDGLARLCRRIAGAAIQTTGIRW